MKTIHDQWRPLLDGQDRAKARQVLQEIARSLVETLRRDSTERTRENASLAGGSAGYALFFDYAARALGWEEDYADLAVESLDCAIEMMAAKPMSSGLFSGFTGIAWVSEHLRRQVSQTAGTETEGDLNEEIDAALQDLLASSPWQASYDLIEGLVGLGVYSLERLPRSSAITCLVEIVDRLSESAEKTVEGVTWFTQPETLGPWGRSLSPLGHYNLGVAHGVPGVLVLLAAVLRAGICEERVVPLLEGGVHWLLSQQNRTTSDSCFSYTTGPGIEPVPARLAWCYGDAGVAAALLTTSRLAGRLDWEQQAIAIAHRAAERRIKQSGVLDAGLCHGSFGLAHLFNRIFQATGDDLFAQTSLYWYREGLAFHEPGRGVAGFLTWDLKDGKLAWVSDSGFLSGAAGIGLALIAAISPCEPKWDRILMANIPSS